ncbi:MAG: sterol desaturase family protein [Sphingomonas sp.]
MTDGMWRVAIFFGLLLGLALLERLAPAREWRARGAARLASHGALGMLSVGVPAAMGWVMRLLIGVGAAAWAASAGFGLFHWIAAPGWLAAGVSIIAMDSAIYFQHRAMHVSPLLWRLHNMHHHDHDLDVTTAMRFHPAEIVASTLYKAAVIVLLGAPVAAALAYEMVLSSMALFNHANIALPPQIERWARLVIVTPSMHVRHHSMVRAEHDSNYGNFLSLWDRLLGTWHAEPPAPAKFPIGLAETQARDVNRLGWLLALPWR